MRRAAVAVLSIASIACAQQIQLPAGLVKKKPRVTFVGADTNIAAKKPTTLQLKFAIDPGFHINSHTPHSATLIATKIGIEDDGAFAVKSVDFPQGHEYSFAASPKDKLDVYSGEFTLTTHVTAKPGAHTLKGILHFQACDTASCYPPSMLPIELHFTAR